jgi:hypothetical protein
LTESDGVVIADDVWVQCGAKDLEVGAVEFVGQCRHVERGCWCERDDVMGSRPCARDSQGLDDVLGVAESLDAADVFADVGDRLCDGCGGCAIARP